MTRAICCDCRRLIGRRPDGEHYPHHCAHGEPCSSVPHRICALCFEERTGKPVPKTYAAIVIELQRLVDKYNRATELPGGFTAMRVEIAHVLRIELDDDGKVVTP